MELQKVLNLVSPMALKTVDIFGFPVPPEKSRTLKFNPIKKFLPSNWKRNVCSVCNVPLLVIVKVIIPLLSEDTAAIHE